MGLFLAQPPASHSLPQPPTTYLQFPPLSCIWGPVIRPPFPAALTQNFNTSDAMIILSPVPSFDFNFKLGCETRIPVEAQGGSKRRKGARGGRRRLRFQETEGVGG